VTKLVCFLSNFCLTHCTLTLFTSLKLRPGATFTGGVLGLFVDPKNCEMTHFNLLNY